MMQSPVALLEPHTPQEAAAHVRRAADDGTPLVFRGGGSHGVPRASTAATVLSTRGLRAVVEYEPQDQTVTVEAGITVAELARILEVNGQRLVLEVAEPERATIGGAIAANAFGARRARFGSLKDLILGVTLVRADGTVARAGGKVVKNVAGFDLAKLVVGSYGALALVTSATLRLHPLPESTRGLRCAGLDAAGVWDVVRATRTRQLEPASIVAVRAPGAFTYTMDIIFEGFPAGVDAQIQSLATYASAAGYPIEEAEPGLASDADRSVRRAGPLRVRCTFPAADLARIDAAVIAPLLSTLEAPSASVYPSLGAAFAGGVPSDLAAARRTLVTARTEVEARGGALIVEAAPPALTGALAFETWGTPPPSFALMRQLKARFDPLGQLNPGSFVGGL